MVNRYGVEVAQLVDGNVLLSGGGSVHTPALSNLVVTELYNPVTGLVTAAANMLHARRWHTVTALPDGRALAVGGETGGGSTRTATAEIFANDPRPAAGLYRLGSSWPVLREEHTDPTEKIVILIDKSIVPPETLLPAGYSEKFPLDIYRSIQIVSKVNLRSLPPPETWDTTQHVQFPQLLLAVYPIWDTSQSNQRPAARRPARSEDPSARASRLSARSS
jgi:hypothetical protein